MNDSVGGEDVSCCDPGTVGHHHLGIVKVGMRRMWRVKIKSNQLIMMRIG